MIYTIQVKPDPSQVVHTTVTVGPAPTPHGAKKSKKSDVPQEPRTHEVMAHEGITPDTFDVDLMEGQCIVITPVVKEKIVVNAAQNSSSRVPIEDEDIPEVLPEAQPKKVETKAAAHK